MNHLNGKRPPFAIPRLENGDRLTRPEFERRYEAMKKPCRAELIEGVVYMPSPARWASHGGPHSDILIWLGNYRIATPGVDSANDATVRLDLANEPQPDAVMVILPEYGGQAVFSADDYLEQAPELVAEVSASTASIDLGAKLIVYQRNGVREYIVWRVLDDALDWFVLRNGAYERLVPDPLGILKSEVFPGLWLAVAALLRRDGTTVLAVLQQGLASVEHARFSAQLQTQRQT